ncbi:MAG TPA: RNA polymerase factor sigma-32 [Desulfobacterales bacterium]|nr:RNA polymerase factor sigma-32 [Desulfobacterales bacterium]
MKPGLSAPAGQKARAAAPATARKARKAADGAESPIQSVKATVEVKSARKPRVGAMTAPSEEPLRELNDDAGEPLAEDEPADTAEEITEEAIGERGGKPKKSLKAEKKDKSDGSDKALVKFDPLQRYLSEISKYRLLTRDEEREFGLRVREQGDKEAAYALVTANLRLVVKIALEFQRVWMQNLLDLIQEGNIGLMQAVKKFDPYKNVKFSYYASFWIKAYILKFIMDNWRLVKIGTTQGQRKLFFKLKKEKQHLIDQGFDPKPKLLSERLGVSEREIVDMDQRLDSWDVSLDAPLKNDSETERIEFLSTDSESVEEQVSKKEIELLLHNKITEFRKKMTPREIEIFELRIFSENPVTLQEIGDRYGISRERVRQVEKNIIRKMREFFKREIPDFASYAEDTGME